MPHTESDINVKGWQRPRKRLQLPGASALAIVWSASRKMNGRIEPAPPAAAATGKQRHSKLDEAKTVLKVYSFYKFLRGIRNKAGKALLSLALVECRKSRAEHKKAKKAEKRGSVSNTNGGARVAANGYQEPVTPAPPPGLQTQALGH